MTEASNTGWPESPTWTAFLEQKALWTMVMGSKTDPDRHSIHHQLFQLSRNAATFRVILEARRLAQPAPEGGMQLNGAVHRFINDCFFKSYSVDIRRVADTSSPLQSQKGERDVFSLGALLKDMRSHCGLITRVNLLRDRNLPYNPEPTRLAESKFIEAQFASGKKAFSVPTGLDAGEIEEYHERVDTLTGTNPATRKPTDQVLPVVFDQLLSHLESATSQIEAFVNKNFAHAAAPSNRNAGAPPFVSLDELWNANREICRITQFLDLHLLKGGQMLYWLPEPQFDNFKYMDVPLASQESLPSLRAIWRTYQEETGDWGTIPLEEVCPKPAT